MKLNKQPIMYWSLELLILSLLIWVCTKIDFIFRPILIFISVVFVPVIISLFLYVTTDFEAFSKDKNW